MINMEIKKRAKLIVDALENEYPDAKCSLTYEKPYELLIATRLSAQCTDARVNLVTPALFNKYQSIEDFANAELSDVEDIIKSCGLYKTKAKDIINLSIMLRDKFNSILPDNMEDLTSLPGIGRKTANLVLGDVFGKEAVVVDTHCIRITNLLGLSKGQNQLSVEKQLREVLPMDRASDFCHRLVIHGRAVCVARKPKCEACCLNKLCDFYNQK